MEKTPFEKDLLDRFLRYVQVDTMSDPHVTDRRPTTAGQMDLLRMVDKELADFGITDRYFDPNGYLIARLPSNLPGGRVVKTIGFMAHVDTADDVMGNGVKPRIIDAYDGKDILLNSQYTLSVENNPALVDYIGKTLVVTDGTTLLGADDKAGLAIIMSVAKRLVEDPSILHGDVEFIITTDEETGAGMDLFPIKKINSSCCYTLDGGPYGELEAECFNASTVNVTFTGVPFHLGAARGKMVNSVT
ncbi:MAG: tripeptide aminopeptidase PepT, partial [Sphaerochaetaceae bacterium]|nr:tripeptide aminopeptidase PepT [Sphaerochaetaceae bacterium]